jgi:hypothetical protein
MLAGSRLFTKEIRAESGDVVRELDIVRLFRFFAIFLAVVGVIGSFGLIVIPSHLPKRVEGEEDTEEDALLPRSGESETSSVISFVSAQAELTAERRPFLTDKSTYLFGLVLMVLLGTGEMFINCVCVLIASNISWERCYRQFDQVANTFLRSMPVAISLCSHLRVPSLGSVPV